MADKHLVTLEVLQELGVDLSVPREVEFNIISTFPIDERMVQDFAALHGWRSTVDKLDDLYVATLIGRTVISEDRIRLLSEAVETFCKEQGWDYEGWGAFTYK